MTRPEDDHEHGLTGRASGLLLHVTSLPGRFGVGDLGPEAYRFVDFLVEAGQRYWQILPLGPVGAGNSPYAARSAMAGNPQVISFEMLVDDGLLRWDEVESAVTPSASRAEFETVGRRERLLRLAHRRATRQHEARLVEALDAFSANEAGWLEDYALYMALRRVHRGRPWYEWEPGLVERRPYRLARWRERLRDEIAFQVFLQLAFDRQWSALKRYAGARGIRIIGDLPIYVAHDSADVWAHQVLFTLDRRGRRTAAAGVPPDMFSATGQLWGNPCYRWDVLAARGFDWWVDRFRRALALTDVVRVDHFRGFCAGWQVPAGARNAVTGAWVPAPGADLFSRANERLGRLPVIVEDLGVITPDVNALRQDLGYPGMRVLQFAFGGDASNPYLPHNYARNTVVYTGTHDNDTAAGWYGSATADVRRHLARYLGREPSEVGWDLIRLAHSSVAALSIAPVQDLLGLDSDGRMNLPGTPQGNWGWRLREGELRPDHASRLHRLTDLYGRTS